MQIVKGLQREWLANMREHSLLYCIQGITMYSKTIYDSVVH